LTHRRPDAVHVPTWKASLWVARKELVTSFRDRQTVLYAVVLPLCMYPVLFWIMVQGALFVQGKREHTEVTVGLALAEAGRDLAALEQALARAPAAPGSGEWTALEEDADDSVAIAPIALRRAAQALDAEGARTWFEESRDDQELDAVLWVGSGGDALGRLYFDSTRSRSRLARQRVHERLAPYLEQARVEAARERGVAADELASFDVQRANVAPQRDMFAYVLSFLLPMLLVVMCVMGAFFPAVDLTAGEKERSTVETTLVLPVRRLAVQQGKILAVCASSVLATALNLLALGLSAGHLLSMVSGRFDVGVTELPVLALVAILPLALLFAFFVSAVLVAVASLAASFKEGQALLGPVQMLFILPAMAGVLPGLELDLRTACLPVVNVVLAFRAMLQNRALPLEYTVTAATLLVYALIAIRLAVRVLGRESVALAGETVPLRRLFALLRKPGEGVR
jgi:sodium transport system permease protein